MNKKGVSIMIGYVLLVAIAFVMGVITYSWLQGFTPSERMECPEGVSIGISEVDYRLGGDNLNITLKNNGRFNIEGFYIRVSDSIGGQTNKDISEYYTGTSGGGLVIFNGGQLETGRERKTSFNFSDSDFSKKVCSIEILPARVIVEENKNRILTCSDALITQEIDCEGLPNPVLWLKLDENFDDYGSSGNEGIGVGGPLIKQDIYKNSARKVLELNGTNYLTIPTADDDSLEFGKNSFSVSLWMKTSQTANKGAFANGYYDWGPGFGVYGPGFLVTNGSTDHSPPINNPTPIVASGYPLEWRDGTWRHFVFVVDRDNKFIIRSYVNGGGERNSEDYRNRIENNIDLSETDKNLLIGAIYGSGAGNIGYYFNGRIDDFRIYDEALTKEEVGIIYNSY